MFAQIVLVQQCPLHLSLPRIEHHGVPVHVGHLLHHHRIVDGVHRILSPGKGAMAVHQDARDSLRISLQQAVYYTLI